MKHGLILFLAGVLMVGCATGSWRPLNGQDAAQLERDEARCKWTWNRMVWSQFYDPHFSIFGDPYFPCMERAGYEWFSYAQATPEVVNSSPADCQRD